jgi:hypothetical protein
VKVFVAAMPGPYSSERGFVDVCREDVGRALAKIPDKNAWAATNIGDLTQIAI